ncbi:MAG: iron ABC transporter permease [Deltaproteobacteria bacterium]|nr:iron ABC transporter permease [Deltaproteobacteria bacterium]
MAKRIFLTFIVMLLIVIGLLPVLSMLIRSVTINGHFSLAAYGDVLTSARQWTLMGHSLALAALVTVLAVAAGMPLGILLEKTDLPFRKFFSALFVIPLLIPPYIVAVSWFDLLGREGLAAHLLGSSVTETTARLLFGLPGCTAVMSSIFLPIPMLLTMVFLRTINPRLEEAGRLVSGWRGVLGGITLPHILPGVLLSAILVFLLSFGEFSVPNFLRYDVFPVESFTQFSAFYNFRAATAAAVPLAAVALILLCAEAAFLRERTYQLRPSTRTECLPPIELGALRKWFFVSIAIAALVIVILPIAVLIVQSNGIDAYAEALSRAGSSLLRSLLYAAIGATLLACLGFFTGYLIQTKALKCWRTVDSITIFLFALSSTVIGIGLICLWNTPWTNLIYSTPLIIILGYLAKYTALTSRISAAQLAQIPPSMEEAAQVAGAGWFRRMAFIVAPLARRGLIGGWLIGYIFSLRDTGITMLVYPAGHETMPVRIFTLMANGSPQLIAALCMLMITATLLPAGILWILPGFLTRKRIT